MIIRKFGIYYNILEEYQIQITYIFINLYLLYNIIKILVLFLLFLNAFYWLKS